MANWAGAVETFGKGLFAVGMKMTQREDDEIAFMRQKALQELGIKAQKELQTQNQEFLSGMEEKRQEFESVQQGKDMAFRAGERAASNEQQLALTDREEKFRLRLEGGRQNFEREMGKLKTQEEARQRTEYQLTAIGKDLQELRLKKAELKASGEAMDPAAFADFDAMEKALMEQAELVRITGIATERRLGGEAPIDYPGSKGPTKEAAAAAAAEKKVSGKETFVAQLAPGAPAGAYTGSGRKPAEVAAAPEAGGTLFDPIVRPKPGSPWGMSAGEINQKIAGSVGSAITAGNSPTSRINRQLAARLRGMTLEEYEAELARKGQ